ncbi:Glycosyl hydrolases family 28 [Granulicella pectinivorans]|uniref:Glycosyl hydrolases family 28 n=1 Tax=Granulicella pectinivorans TaxID=474950 RepID=A0A1I6M9V6_9BACT|nr:glycosyl hydrolase family 28 protein [Granulicella pectinivorans]SFS12441.1 Glycosyl hydrolases family 28 [Granulicella pectinivorans]
MATRRSFLFSSLSLAGLNWMPSFAQSMAGTEINVSSLGAVGDGITLDTAAIQQAIDRVSSAGGGRVIVPGGKRFLVGALMLKSNVDFHLAEDAVLLASPDKQHYPFTRNNGIINANGATNVRISGTGHVDGQGMKFMGIYSPVYERWEPLPFRPRMFHLIACTGLEISGISFGHAPEWGLHTLGCDHVLVEGIKVRNYLDVPNCDAMDPDRCRDMEIRNCDIVCADDGIVLKTSEQKEGENYGVMQNVTVRDCSVVCRDSGIKIGTETFGDISKILFERCRIVSGGRGPTITHRQPGNIEDVEFRDIDFLAQHHAARWWGWGEAASVTVWPRTLNGKTGTLSNIRFRNVHGVAENSFRIDAHPDMPIRNVLLEDCSVKIDRWTQYPGGMFDDRPTRADDPMHEPGGLEKHDTPAYSLRNVQGAVLRNCTASWGLHQAPYFSYALEAENVSGLKLENFKGTAARPGMPATLITHKP